MKKILSCFEAFDMNLLYLLEEETDIVGFTVIPKALGTQYVTNGDWKVESLIQLKCIKDDMPTGFSGGHTMRNSGTCWSMKYTGQISNREDGKFEIITQVQSKSLRGIHKVTHEDGRPYIMVHTELENIGTETETMEMLSSFSLCSLFGVSEKERTNDFRMHRLRSCWSEEGRMESRTFMEMQLEPSWQKYGVQSIRYGQVGSMPVRRYFPWFALEDRKTECMIGGSLKLSSSWQIEIFSEDERPAVSGGIADREFGHWMKHIEPGDKFLAPDAILSCCTGSLDDLCNRITRSYEKTLENVPSSEKRMPIIFNEFCTTFGKPSEKRIDELIKKVGGRGITYFMIDAGWQADSQKSWESNMGDWDVNKEQFPNGLKSVADKIRAAGMIPGIWFEPETIGKDAKIYQDDSMLLTRDGYPITTGRRRFMDMRRIKVQSYLGEKVIRCLKENGFGYLKTDYNDTIGLGCDGDESLGENLRVHMECVRTFYRKIREVIPELVMENCASGGHRLEPSMMELFSMSSFSDAHECVSIPIIAANVNRAIRPQQNQIWAVVRSDAEEKRIRYLMTAAFLGRMCLSGEVDRLSETQWKLIDKSIIFYKKVAQIIKRGDFYRYGSDIQSYLHPEGYQIAVLKAENEAIIIVHSFKNAGFIRERLNRLKGFEIQDYFGDENMKLSLDSEGLFAVDGIEDFDGAVLYLQN